MEEESKHPYTTLKATMEVQLAGNPSGVLETDPAGNVPSEAEGGRIGGGEDQAGSSPAVTAVADTSLVRLIFAAMVAGGVQYGWALQLSLLTPYVQTLGISHALSSLMWLCGPITGFLVQPFVGIWSDRCHLRFGRRRPFIFVGCLLICVSVIIIGFSADIGYALGDSKEDCSTYHGPRWKAAIVVVIGFWLLDFSNNIVQCPARALMADLSGNHGYNAANSIFSSWIAFGNILGYSSGASGGWHRWFPFLKSKACCEACANLKGAFLVAVVFLIFCMIVTVIAAKEIPMCDAHNIGANELEDSSTVHLTAPELQNEDMKKSRLADTIRSIRHLPPGMPSVLLVTSLSWLSWFPFFLYNTDWMGRDVYHGNPNGTLAEIDAYNRGVREGALGLLLNSVILGVTSFMIEPMCRKLTARILWVMSNLILFVLLAIMSVISIWSLKDSEAGSQQIGADHKVKVAALVLVGAFGFPLAILFSVPCGVTAQLASNEGGGQGLCAGVLNISVVIPQVIVALSAGPWDSLFGKGNMPAFAFSSAAAFVSAIVGIYMLPKLSRNSFKFVTGSH